MRNAIVATLGEFRKSLLISWTYRLNLLGGLATVGFIFVGISFLMGQGELNPEQMASMLLGYLAFFYALIALNDLSFGLRGEAWAGTLEQMSMSPAPIGLILLGRVLANLAISTAQVLLMGGGLFLLAEVQLPMRWQGLPGLALILMGVLGFGFVVAGTALIFKQVESFINLMGNMLVFLNGTLLPVDAMPGWLAALARVLPSTQGVVVLRKVVLGGQSLASTWQDSSLKWLVVHSAVFFAVGWVVFSLCERTAKKQGSLGQY